MSTITTTRKEQIIIKYDSLLKSLKNKAIIDVLPSLEEMDLIDIIYFFNLYFTTGCYKENLSFLLEMKSINLSDGEFNELYDLVLPFIDWLKNL